MNGAQALFKALTDAGLDTCFANPGTSEMQLVYEMGRTKDTRVLLCLEENVVIGGKAKFDDLLTKPARRSSTVPATPPINSGVFCSH